ncbi:Pyridoxamine 5'-phosphate oxidase-like FMN-binding protein [Nitrosopumilaceae archaeon]|nr:pyridoxamine 5'-phosphate oxidase family protein [Nitrosopumilus sp.]CAI9832418.1 Pyridoxamine 5'-phosphate oxidase-like FMN-binding protein [Nitrosopumilaceae archaeon]MDA7942048.1 pyridoxamine 5'-phosphate oxidase family protein [Nitrosopumilus sp.]MDA7943080.1 pyridoxamine 5'-phosphate oxidase family protein [Nitrosopumilus sp.]MDA7945172.1 pyridoxamine 5'-phosphate oxidase family protein [Nitrosopumilus sp.]
MRRSEFLRSQRLMRLATCSASGRPHVAPVWYIYSGGRAYVGTASRTAKARNVEETGRAAFCVDEGVRSPIRGVMAECAASLIRGKRADRMARRIIARYMDPACAEARELLDDTDCVICLEPSRFTSWTY